MLAAGKKTSIGKKTGEGGFSRRKKQGKEEPGETLGAFADLPHPGIPGAFEGRQWVPLWT